MKYQVHDLSTKIATQGLRVLTGIWSAVSVAGGWRQTDGHGTTAAAHGLGADNALEYEVVAIERRKFTFSPQGNEDLFSTINGGGAGNYAVVNPATDKTERDGLITS